MVSIAQEMELTFSQISKVLLREKRGFSIACIRLLPLGNCEQGMYLGTKVPDQHLRAVVWSHLTPEGEEGVVEEDAETWPLLSHSALQFHSSPFSEPPILPSHSVAAAATVSKSLQSCPTLCDPIDGSPPGSPVPGILQARTLEWVAISFSNA